MNELINARHSDAIMVPRHVAPEGLARLFAGLKGMRSLAGIIVTTPHKQAAAALCDELATQAALIGAVNAIRRTEEGRFLGETFDGRGFVAGLLGAGHPLDGRPAFLGGPGAPRSPSPSHWPRPASRISHLAIHNRTAAKAHLLADRVAQHFPDITTAVTDDRPHDVALAVNATSVGMREGDALPFQVDRLGPNAVVAEIIMQPAITPLLEVARQRGLMIQPGKAMLDQQLALIADFVGV